MILFRGSLFNPPAEAGDFPFKDHGTEYAQVVRSLEWVFSGSGLPANLSYKIGNLNHNKPLSVKPGDLVLVRLSDVNNNKAV